MSHNQAVGATHDEPQIEGLQPGAKLLRGQYEILRFLSNGGFGITYLARDSLERDVVIKECYPSALCRRNGDFVEAVNPGLNEDLRAIIDLFILEARNHARLVHPNIVDVHQVFEDNNTAYIAMDFVRGCDLLEFVENAENRGDPEFIVQVTEKMLSAVSFIHQSGMLHRDISPDNILINENGEPILIDFGAAREQAAHKSTALLTLRVIKDGYSPHEFYVRGAEQSPSSDLYVLAATLYHAITGERPIDGQTRLNAFNNGQSDPYVPLSGRYSGYPSKFLNAIDKALEVHTTDRLQSALDWLRMFRGPDVIFDTFAYRPVSVIVGMDHKDHEAEKERIKAETENAEAVVTALLAGNADLTLGNEEKPEQEHANFATSDNAPVTVDTVVKSGSGSGSRSIVLVVIALAAVVTGMIILMSGENSTPKATPVTVEAPAPIDAVPEPVEQTVEVQAEPESAEPALAPETEVAQEQPVEQTVIQEPDSKETLEPPLDAVPASEIPPAEISILEVGEKQPELEAEAALSESEIGLPLEELINLLDNQVAFAHWDVDVPFTVSRRRASTGNVLAISGIDADQDMSVVGDWVQRGTTIFTLNGEPIRADLSFEAHILSNFAVEPDGYVRVTARYRALGKTRAQNAVLALPAYRSLGLENGLTFSIRHVDGYGWQTSVQTVPNDSESDLRRGDVLLREGEESVAFDGPESLDVILENLVAESRPTAELTVLRNGSETAATMRLAQE
ncbi:serine/threonine protein kinase [Ruegeria arenilitoris]|uniref:serine/threonine protein kinase n=1 Tax=Ruegeria arenilitoris TaxID=1173585 RepID=UPI00147B3752|nr:serine/threonine-protein kinase [Ruegeria arenilitoris]